MTGKITTREFWIKEPGRGALVDGSISAPEDGSVQVRTLYSGISRGTEALVFRGEVPGSQQEAMRCPFQQGDFPAPVKYGYMSVGVVEADPGSGSSLQGRHVFCLHPHQDRYVVPREAVTALPDGLPPERAVLAANMETAVNASWDAAPATGDRVVVVGGGVVGLLTAWLVSRTPGSETTLVDPNPARGAPAEALGLEHTTDLAGEGFADLVIHASGNPAGLRDALTWAGDEAKVVELSWFGSREVTLPLGEAFHSRRLTLKSSQVGRIPPGRAPRWSHRRHMELALRLLRDPALDVLITGE
ncbi:MAG: zinc-binding alcohol dehydrogenase, partial [Longimicrobiales bacterium]|nr:zinc-binding alcohol dehydrogenase [Longimicrobiales bacterium]